MQPAKSPPPRMVDPIEKNASSELESGVPARRSRIPPCTINTARVNSDPMPNHHTNVRIFPHGMPDRGLPNLFSAFPKRTITVSTNPLECQEKDLRQSTTGNVEKSRQRRHTPMCTLNIISDLQILQILKIELCDSIMDLNSKKRI